MPEALNAIAGAIVDDNRYMVLGTADASGRPWATPVYYAAQDCRDFYWVSALDRIRGTSPPGPRSRS